MDLSAVILAGGASRRMGQDKAWLRFNGRPLLELAVDKVRKLGIEEVFVSGRWDVDYSSVPCPVLLDLEPEFGPLGGIERALQASHSPLVLVLAVDMPRMTTEFLQRLVDGCDHLTGAVPKLHGRLEPLVAVYPKRCHAFAFELIRLSRHTVRDFVAACRRERAVRIIPVPRWDARCMANWNSREDVRLSAKTS